jgi:hypothetical protein
MEGQHPMAKTLEAHDKLIREIFEGSYEFEIPDYQRPYAWTTEQAEELISDLVSAMQDARTSGAKSQYFLGSIVLIKNDREPRSSVVDGQQRLSTLMAARTSICSGYECCKKLEKGSMPSSTTQEPASPNVRKNPFF